MRSRLSERQQGILRRVVEDYVATGQPVGSRTLVERSDLGVSPSTVRGELAELERIGLLTHPHTSAGRVPTESATGSTSTGCSNGRSRARASSRSTSARAVRGGGGAAGDDRDAVAGDEAARARLGSAAPGRDRPACRGADAPAAGRDDGRDHVARRRDEAAHRVPDDVDPGLASWAADYLNDR